MSPAPRRMVRVQACAKINLTLRVLGIRADGYHELRTTFQSLALHDTLTFAPQVGPLTITSDDPLCPTDSSNLVWQAAERLWKAAGRKGRPGGARVHIAKRIPMQAGLGGGSSDAASALRALSLVWQVGLSDAELEDIGRALGADVAFFLTGGTVLGVERGDLLYRLEDAEPAFVVLARPGFGVITREAYGWWDEDCREQKKPTFGPRRRLEEQVNDLQKPVCRRRPAIAKLVREMERRGARAAAMSGSGSAVFGLFDDKDSATAAAQAIAASGLTTWVTRTTRRREHVRVSAPEWI